MMYGAFHQISIVGRDEEARQPTVVAGPLCEARTLIAANYYCRRRRVASFVPAELGRVFEEINQTTDDRYHRLWLRV